MTIVVENVLGTKNKIRNFLSRYGSHAISYHTLQPELSYFRTKVGYIAYRKFKDEILVLGDPIANFTDYAQIISEFIKFQPTCSFIQVSHQTATVLRKYNFSVNHFGDESQIALPYYVDGKRKKEIRNLLNSARRNNIVVREIHNREHLLSCISKNDSYTFKKFYPQSRLKEYSFLARPLANNDEKDVRIFGGFQDDNLVCYSLLDPIYLDNKIIGYAEAIIRQAEHAPKGCRTFTLIKAMEIFEKENVAFVNIGLLPFYPHQNSDDTLQDLSNKMVSSVFEMLYKTSPLVSNFAGLSFHKSRYRGEMIPKYFATNSKKPYKPLLFIYKLTSGNWLPNF